MLPATTTSSRRGDPREQVAVSEVPVLRHHDATVAVGALSYPSVG
jgi:hypothetical protein